jgi:mannose-6-phosphate isomerase
MRPIELGANQIRRFYRGGSRIAAFRGLPPGGDDAPEDWVASTTTVHEDGELGLSRLQSGALLRDVLAGDAGSFFEPTHLAEFGSDPAVLIKLLDAGERLPLHVHPDARFAKAHLGAARHCKTEAWIIVEAEPGAHVHVGFARDIAEDELAAMVASQDVDALIAAMNLLPIRAGDSIFVPAGTPHVIHEGILLLELQEPSDLSLLLEYGPMSEADAFLGLKRELALTAVTRSRVQAAELERWTTTRGASLFPAEADGFFRAERLGGGSTLEPAFSVVGVTEGEGVLETEHGALAVRRGSTVLVPFAAGTCALTGACRAIRCRPPVA